MARTNQRGTWRKLRRSWLIGGVFALLALVGCFSTAAEVDGIAVEIDVGQPLTAVALSADGSTVVAGDDRGRVYRWSAEDGAPLSTLDAHAAGIVDIVLAANVLVSAGQDGFVKSWDGDLLRHEHAAHETAITALARRPGTSEVVSADANGDLQFWSYADGELGERWSHAAPVRALAFSPDGGRLFVGGDTTTVTVYAVADGTVLSTLDATQIVEVDETIVFTPEDADGFVYAVAYSPDNDLIAAGGDDTLLRTWRVDRVNVDQVFPGGRGSIQTAEFHPSGRFVATGGDDNTLRLWNTNNGRVLYTVGHFGAVTDLAFTPNGLRLASASADGRVRVFIINANDREGLEVNTFFGGE